MQIQLPDSLGFLKSTRFWAMVFGILATYLSGEITAVEAIQAFFAGFVGVRTFDRFGEKVGGANKAPVINNTAQLNT